MSVAGSLVGGFRSLAQRGSSYRFLLWVAGEIFIVVAGVPIAFGMNAWWAERSARIEEQTHLRALIRDERLRAVLAGFADRAVEPYQERFSDQVYLDFTTRYLGRLRLAGPAEGGRLIEAQDVLARLQASLDAHSTAESKLE